MQILIFRANSRKVSQWVLLEEGLNYNLELKNLGRFEKEKNYKHSKLTYFGWVISQNLFINSKKFSLLQIQAYVPVFKINIVHLTQKCSLRVKNHAFVKVDLA